MLIVLWITNLCISPLSSARPHFSVLVRRTPVVIEERHVGITLSVTTKVLDQPIMVPENPQHSRAIGNKLVTSFISLFLLTLSLSGGVWSLGI